jgi:hypothetical protein
MTLNEIQVGAKLEWNAGWQVYPVTVRKVGKRRVTVETMGGHKASVEPRNLMPMRWADVEQRN